MVFVYFGDDGEDNNKKLTFSIGLRGISQLGSAFIFLR